MAIRIRRIIAPVTALSPPNAFRPSTPKLASFLLLFAVLAGVSQIDVPSASLGVKGDEATYVSMALSVAYDFDLKFTAADLERFWAVYRAGPEGIFLKRGRRLTIEWVGALPRLRAVPRPADAGLEYGKALLYPVVAAPFIRAFGLPGLLMLNVLLLALVIWCGALFAAARGAGPAGAFFAFAFVLASVTPVYVVWLTPEIFNFTLVFVAYFLWMYKDAPGATAPRWVLGSGSDAVAALLLGCATFSKPPNALLILPIVTIAAARKRWGRMVLVGFAFAAGSAGLFGVTGLISGDMNYQGGDRRTFYGRYPYSDPAASFATLGTAMATDESEAEDLLAPDVFWPAFRHNIVYFFLGRDAGLIPYFFPGLVMVALWLARRKWRDPAVVLALAVLVASAIVLLALAPNSWSGGGGPPGNRYFLSLYPVMFFAAPATATFWPAVAAWVGGMVFVAPLLLNPFAASKFTWRAVDTPALRLLPIELTMVDDLPVRLSGSRGRVPFGQTPDVLLYFMDENAWTPEGHGVWVAGRATAEIIVRADRPLDRLRIVWRSPIRNNVRASIAGRTTGFDLEPGAEAISWLQLGPGVTYIHDSHAYVLRLRTSAGFVPILAQPGSADTRFLGAFAELTFFDKRPSP
jgi:hypothetical protein